LSVDAFVHRLDLLAADRRVKGVVIVIDDLQAGMATLASLRQALLRFRSSGKQAIAYLHDLSMWTYYLASACDQVLAPESVHFRAAGLWSETLFLRDTLALVGLQADIEAIAEYKVSPDTLRRTEMTEPHREMLESILDAVYAQVLEAIASGRERSAEQIQKLMDEVPLTAKEAAEVGLLDAVCYEDEVLGHLGTDGGPVTLIPWEKARRRLVRPRRWRSRRAIGVISLEGTIVTGPSRQPPLPIPLPLPMPSAQAGSGTLVQQLRSAAQDKHLAAIILHVDSPGGSALASDLIWREIVHLRRTKPLVVYMGNQAASGGYYVSAPASAIVAQPTTITGSIGIWGGKIVTRGLYEKIEARREIVARGKAAGLYADAAPFSDEERAKIRADIGAGYVLFKERVAAGRAMAVDEVETIARGRVWTGKQALANGLVDTMGDMVAAAEKARQLAGLDPRRYSPLVDVPPPKRTLLPGTVPADAGAWLAGLTSLLREGVFALAPWTLRFRG
jgi:protease-4